MTPQPSKDRDPLDKRLSKALKSIRLAVSLPHPADDEPSDEEILMLVEGQLSGETKKTVEAKIEKSRYSKDRFEILREALADAEARTRLSPDESNEKKTSVARLVFAMTKRGADRVLAFLHGTDSPMALTPAMATRGGTTPSTTDDYYRFERQLGDLDAVIQIEHVPNRGVELRLDVKKDGAPLTGARASLRRDGKLVESVRIRDGVAGFVDLAPDTYQLELSQQDAAIGTLELDVLEA